MTPKDEKPKPFDAFLERASSALLMIVLNAAMTWGVVSTQLQWLRSDIDRQQRQIDKIENWQRESHQKKPIELPVVRVVTQSHITERKAS